MTDAARRHRGRPKGSEIDDGKALSQIAELLAEGRAHNVAAAVRVLAGHDPSLIRRLQRKFRRDRETLLNAARSRQEHLALQEGMRQNQILRATRPASWRHEHDATTQLFDALNLDQEERLRRAFAPARSQRPAARPKGTA